MRVLAIVAILGCSPPAVSPDVVQVFAAQDRADAARGVAVPLTGCWSAFAAGFAIGSSKFRLQIDTGSDLIAVAGSACDECRHDGVTTRYAPGPDAKAVAVHHKAVYGYNDEAWWSGDAFVDRVAAGETGTPVGFFAIDHESNLFPDVPCTRSDGVFGMQGSGSTSWFGELVEQRGIPDRFALRTCGLTGTMWLGGDGPHGDPSYVPMDDDYAINVRAVAIGTDAAISLPPNTSSRVDSGAMGMLPAEIYDALADQLDRDDTFRAMFGTTAGWSYGDCGTTALTREQLDERLPRLTVRLDGVELELTATESYFVPMPPEAYCFALRKGDRFEIGGLPMRGYVTIFDRANKRMGFVGPTGCND